MRRREIIAGIAYATAAWPLASRAQQQKLQTVGVLVRGAPGSERFLQFFPKALAELGYVEGQNIRYEIRSDEGDITRLPGLAAELVRLKVDVIVTWLTPTAIAAKQATREIPIVCARCGNMVESGLIPNLSRPGGNITGMSQMGAEVAGKIIELTHEMLPSARRIAALVNAPDPFSKPFLQQVQQAGDGTGISIDPLMIHQPEELDAAFSEMEKQRPDAVIVQPSLPTTRAAQLAFAHRLPIVGLFTSFAADGGLMSYSPSEADTYGKSAVIVVKILKGAKPAEIPAEQPTKFALIINLKSAKALGLTIPPSILARADEVIE